MIPDPRYLPALIVFEGMTDEGGIGTLWCVGAAGSAQEEDEVCEDILKRNVVPITPFGCSGILPPYIRLSTRQNASFRRVRQSSTKSGSCHCSTELPWL